MKDFRALPFSRFSRVVRNEFELVNLKLSILFSFSVYEDIPLPFSSLKFWAIS
jgi:hypothetical protein